MLTGSRLLAAAVSGIALVVISPPANLHWLHWFSFVPLLWALRDDDHAGNFVLAWITGYLGVFTCYFWLAETVVRFSNMPGIISLVVVHVYALAFGFPYALVFVWVRPLRRAFGAAWIPLLAALQVTVEYGVPALFPYFQGVSQYRVAPIWQLASITGVGGVTALVFLVNAALAEGVYRYRERRPLPWRILAVMVAIWTANLVYGSWRYRRVEETLSEGPRIRVAMMQQDITMEERYSGTAQAAVQSWFDLTARILGKDVDLVVWPEGSSPYNPDEPPMKGALEQLVKAGKFEILVGGGTREGGFDPETGEPDFTYYNSCYLMNRTGEIAGRYDKMVPLPFGEYIPFAETFPFLADIIQGPGDFRAGTTPTVFEADGYTFAVPICYEAILTRIVRKMKNADLFINITNDAWFGDTASPHQHAMLAAVRSVEYGRPTLRIAYTGINMVVEPHGRIRYETDPFEDVVEINTLRLATFDTPYWRWGDWFPAGCALASLLSLLLLRRRRRRSSAADAPPHRP